MNKIAIQGDGFPATNKTWRFLADMISSLHKLALLGGQDYILEGVVVGASSSVATGWVVIKGELLPVKAGTGTHLAIKQTIEKVTYLEDLDKDGAGDIKDTYFDRWAEPTTTATGNVLISGLTRKSTAALLIGFADLKPDLKASIDLGAGTTIDWTKGVQFKSNTSTAATFNLINPVEGKSIVVMVSGDRTATFSNISNPAAMSLHDRTKTNMYILYCYSAKVGNVGYTISLIVF